MSRKPFFSRSQMTINGTPQTSSFHRGIAIVKMIRYVFIDQRKSRADIQRWPKSVVQNQSMLYTKQLKIFLLEDH